MNVFLGTIATIIVMGLPLAASVNTGWIQIALIVLSTFAFIGNAQVARFAFLVAQRYHEKRN